MEREREKVKIKMERTDLVDSLRKEVVQRLQDGFLEGKDGAEGLVFEGLSEKKRGELVERELKKEINRGGNEAALELDYEDMEREVDFRVESRKQRREYLESAARQKIEEQEQEGKEKELTSRREKLEKMQVRFHALSLLLEEGEGKGKGGKREGLRGSLVVVARCLSFLSLLVSSR